MIDLARSHPALRSLGACAVLTTKLKGAALAVFGIIAEDAANAAKQTVELVRETATDADYLASQISLVAADGVITAEESAKLLKIAAEIRDQAITGRIV